MFTGIVQGTAKVVSIDDKPNFRTHVVELPAHMLEGLETGASVANNGCCLTVTEINGAHISFDLMKETLRITNLGDIQIGDEVNVERAAKFSDEIGGHLMSGHIMTTAEIVKILTSENNRQIWFKVQDPTLMKYILYKGFIGIDGISLTVGEVMPNFIYDTPFATGLTLSDTVQKTPKTALLFLRYYGCTLCQYDIHQLAENYHQITDVGGQVIVVLQSDPTGLAQELQPDTFPFSILCDPKAALYERFGIQPAASMAKMADAGTMLKIAKATASGYKHGAYEGNELQLPACFVVDKERKILYAHYGKSAGNTPDARTLASLLK